MTQTLKIRGSRRVSFSKSAGRIFVVAASLALTSTFGDTALADEVPQKIKVLDEECLIKKVHKSILERAETVGTVRGSYRFYEPPTGNGIPSPFDGAAYRNTDKSTCWATSKTPDSVTKLGEFMKKRGFQNGLSGECPYPYKLEKFGFLNDTADCVFNNDVSTYVCSIPSSGPSKKMDFPNTRTELAQFEFVRLSMLANGEEKDCIQEIQIDQRQPLIELSSVFLQAIKDIFEKLGTR